MKNKIGLIFMLFLALSVLLTGCGRGADIPEETVSEAEATEESAPAQETFPVEETEPPVPVEVPVTDEGSDIIITKHPGTDPTVLEGSTQIYTARADNARLVSWQFLSPDGYYLYTDSELDAEFGVKVARPDSTSIWIQSLSAGLNGYRVRAVFENGEYTAYSDWAEISVSDFFETVNGEFVFTSGAGGWSTVIELSRDGSFTGKFSDWDAIGPNGEARGYYYECAFTGSFGKPGRVGEKIYTLELTALDIEGTVGEKYTDDMGTVHEITQPYGFDKASLFYVYLPGIEVRYLEKGFLPWAHMAGDAKTFDNYAIYNYYGQLGFVKN